MVAVEVLRINPNRSTGRKDIKRKPQNRMRRDSDETTFRTIVENCASIIIQSQARRYLVRSSRRTIIDPVKTNEIIDDPTKALFGTRLNNDKSREKEIRPDFFDTLLSHCYSVGVRLSALEVMGLMKALNLLTAREYESVALAWKAQEKEKLHYAPEPQFRLRVHSDEEILKSDLYHAWNLIGERVRQDIDITKLYSMSSQSIFSKIKQKSRIPIEALQALRNSEYETATGVQLKDVQFFLQCLGVQWNRSDNFSSIEILHELNQMNYIDFSLKLRLRTTFQFMKALMHWNLSISHDYDVNEAVLHSYYKIVDLQEDLDAVSKALENARTSLATSKSIADSSEAKPIAESKPVITSRVYDAKSRKTAIGQRKDRVNLNSRGNFARSSKDESSIGARRTVPKVSTVDIVFESGIKRECTGSSKKIPTVEMQNRCVQKNVSKPKKYLANVTRASQNKRATSNISGEKISSDQCTSSFITDKPRRDDIYERANEKLNLILEKLNSKLGDTESNIT